MSDPVRLGALAEGSGSQRMCVCGCLHQRRRFSRWMQRGWSIVGEPALSAAGAGGEGDEAFSLGSVPSSNKAGVEQGLVPSEAERSIRTAAVAR